MAKRMKINLKFIVCLKGIFKIVYPQYVFIVQTLVGEEDKQLAISAPNFVYRPFENNCIA